MSGLLLQQYSLLTALITLLICFFVDGAITL